jgi:hypothetical protein
MSISKHLKPKHQKQKKMQIEKFLEKYNQMLVFIQTKERKKYYGKLHYDTQNEFILQPWIVAPKEATIEQIIEKLAIEINGQQETTHRFLRLQTNWVLYAQELTSKLPEYIINAEDCLSNPRPTQISNLFR